MDKCTLTNIIEYHIKANFFIYDIIKKLEQTENNLIWKYLPFFDFNIDALLIAFY